MSVGLPDGPSATSPRANGEPNGRSATSPNVRRALELGQRCVAESPWRSEMTRSYVAPSLSGSPTRTERRRPVSVCLSNAIRRRSGGSVSLQKIVRRPASRHRITLANSNLHRFSFARSAASASPPKTMSLTNSRQHRPPVPLPFHSNGCRQHRLVEGAIELQTSRGGRGLPPRLHPI
jgi:hypothetical protein